MTARLLNPLEAWHRKMEMAEAKIATLEAENKRLAEQANKLQERIDKVVEALGVDVCDGGWCCS